jgi:hypothetical protein
LRAARGRAAADDGNRLIQADPKDSKGRDELRKIVALQLWHAAAAQSALDSLQQLDQSGQDLSEKEQRFFDQGEQLFDAKNYDAARHQFLDALTLETPNSPLRPKVLEFLGKIRALNDDKKNYEIIADMQNEDWQSAQYGFQSVAATEAPLKDDALKSSSMVFHSDRFERNAGANSTRSYCARRASSMEFSSRSHTIACDELSTRPTAEAPSSLGLPLSLSHKMPRA